MGGSSEGNGHYRRLLDRSPAGLLVTTFDGEILDSNAAAAAALGYEDPSNLIGTNIRDRYDNPDRRRELLERIRQQGEVRHAEFKMRTREGNPAYLLVSVKEESHPEFGDGILLTNWVDVTGQRELRKELEHRARHDDLTGLLNRRALFERSEQVLAMCEREDRKAAVLYLDISDFREINEQIGHQGGDEMLAVVGRRLEKTTRDADLVSRIGGDEFVVLATLLAEDEDAEQVGRRVMHAFDDPFEGAGLPLRLQPAIGIAVYPEDGRDIDTLLHRADTALWGPDREKRPGVRRSQHGAQGGEVIQGWEISRALNRAVERDGELFQVYQPVVSADDGEIVGLESLVRWNHPDHGLLEPGAFIPEAEASGIIRQVDKAVFRDSVRQAAEWNKKGVPFGWVSVNMSAQSLSDPACVEWAGRVLEKYPELRPGRIVIEITEHTAMRQVSRTDILDRLRDDVGLSISIDDFGIGYSSLLYLRQFPADYLKIDMEFVHDLVESEDDQKVVRGIIALGEAFDLELIAEGVETEAQADWLRKAGCHYLQGYRFGRPTRGEEIQGALSA